MPIKCVASQEFSWRLKDLSPEEQTRLVKRGFWDKVKGASTHVPFVRDAVAAYYCMSDEKVPMAVRTAIAVPLAYFVIPTDVIPDVILGLGFTDDALVLGTALKTLGANMAERHYAAADLVLKAQAARRRK